ncbi:MAG: class I SAM-dependent methyltransferase [Rhodocyclaceae bacterium]|nr:class I SAM-dependent methyltransferase [Rhodocyclaceae bacterium]
MMLTCQNLLDQLQSSSDDDEERQLSRALWTLSAWRSSLIQDALLQHWPPVVMQGPLKGLMIPPQFSLGSYNAKLLGCYEQPLLPFIEQAILANYGILLNIGCAEGYYAVGMARRMPDTRVLAFDIDSKAREMCAAMAEANNVSERVQIGSLFKPEQFASYQGQRVLVICDIEGAEVDLLNPESAPALIGMDVIVESHECYNPDITLILVDRFKATHDIALVQDDGQRQLHAASEWFGNLAHIDQLLAVWEPIGGPTPWLVMKARQFS